MSNANNSSFQDLSGMPQQLTVKGYLEFLTAFILVWSLHLCIINLHCAINVICNWLMPRLSSINFLSLAHTFPLPHPHAHTYTHALYIVWGDSSSCCRNQNHGHIVEQLLKREADPNLKLKVTCKYHESYVASWLYKFKQWYINMHIAKYVLDALRDEICPTTR